MSKPNASIIPAILSGNAAGLPARPDSGYAAGRAKLARHINMRRITHLNEAELEESFTRSSGPGGQNVNKVSTRVTLRHLPTNLTISVQDSRSQATNRQLARERLLAALQNREAEAASAERQAREKIRRQHAPRPRFAKARILEAKHHRSRLKKERRRTDD